VFVCSSLSLVPFYVPSSESQNEDIDNDDDSEDASFIVLYKLSYENKHQITSFNDGPGKRSTAEYFLHENLIRCENVFEHDMSSNSFKWTHLIKATSYDQDDSENDSIDSNDTSETTPSKILSIKTLQGIGCLCLRSRNVLVHSNKEVYSQVRNSDLELDMGCLFWRTHSKYYLTLFNLNDWYTHHLPFKINKSIRNSYLKNYEIGIDVDQTTFKVNEIFVG
jgi:hypothetical protein